MDWNPVEEVGTILKAVKGTVVKSFRSNPWMDEGTKKAAIRKSKKITALVGFPDYIKNQVLGSTESEFVDVKSR